MSVLQELTIPEIVAEAESFFSKLVELRRSFHQIAELSWNEHQTMKMIIDHLQSFIQIYQLPLEIHHFKGGLAIDLDFDPSYKKLLFRADVDALPIEEKTGASYTSSNPGVMHACGHDFHIAMLLTAIQIIGKLPKKPPNNFRFVFQRAEETGNENCGGKVLVDEGILNGIDQVIGLHISATADNGTFFSKPGAMLANTAMIELSLECSGGHVMHPHEGSNAIDILADILVSIKGIESRLLSPLSQIALVPSRIQAGNACNIRPNFGTLSLALRNFLEKTHFDHLLLGIKNKIEAVIAGYPTAKLTEFHVEKGYPALINHENSFFQLAAILNQAFLVKESNPLFAGEDFAYYLEQKEGSYWILGAKNKDGHDHHTATFDPDEAILTKGAAFWLLIAYFS